MEIEEYKTLTKFLAEGIYPKVTQLSSFLCIINLRNTGYPKVSFFKIESVKFDDFGQICN